MLDVIFRGLGGLLVASVVGQFAAHAGMPAWQIGLMVFFGGNRAAHVFKRASWELVTISQARTRSEIPPWTTANSIFAAAIP